MVISNTSVSRKQLIGASIATLVLGVLIGWGITNFDNISVADASINKPIRVGHYKLINPLLDTAEGEDRLSSKQLKNFKQKVVQLISEEIGNQKASEVSVYFRDFDDGLSFNINGDAGFEPASLAKLPVMIAYLKMAEGDPALLQKKYIWDNNAKSRLQGDPQDTILKLGESYSVERLLIEMIGHSDNGATQLLFDHLKLDFLLTVLNELGLEYSQNSSFDKLITIKSYAIFLRVLYNASYLNREMSEKALELLAIGDFPQGIMSTVPPKTVVASKYGVRKSGTNNETVQLHDFGIVYYPNRPYLICVMSKGNDVNKLTSVIQDISKFIYNEVDSQYKN